MYVCIIYTCVYIYICIYIYIHIYLNRCESALRRTGPNTPWLVIVILMMITIVVINVLLIIIIIVCPLVQSRCRRVPYSII